MQVGDAHDYFRDRVIPRKRVDSGSGEPWQILSMVLSASVVVISSKEL